MNKIMIKMVDTALEDGILTDKEREILLRKATNLGIDLDEFEMYLENRLGKLNQTLQKEQEIGSRAENITKVFEIERNQKERQLKERELIQQEDEELVEIRRVKMVGFVELREWWNEDLLKEEKKNLRQAINASSNFFGGFNPDDDQLKNMYYQCKKEENIKKFESRKTEIKTERELRQQEYQEKFSIEQAEINRLRSTLTKKELNKINKKGGVFNKLKSIFKT